MNYTNDQINLIIDKYKSFVDELSIKYRYDNNITHLLYIIIPAFVMKYGIENERNITNVFNNVPIIITDVKDIKNPALFTRRIHKDENGYKTIKNVRIKYYNGADLLFLLDSIIHEYNHAINSYKNEINIIDNKIILRTGISYSIYDMNLTFIEQKNITLEEILNTKDTEDIINIIRNLKRYNISNYEINTLISTVNRENDEKYTSKAYYLESFITKELVNNSTFINTLRVLRLNGNVDDINYWFDNITGINNSFNNLNKMLNDSFKIEKELSKTKFFKNHKINKIKDNIKNIMNIINIFNDNCNIK